MDGLSIVASGKLFNILFSPSNLLWAYSESIAWFIPSADIWIKCLRSYCLHNFANKDGKTEWIFLNVSPGFFSNNIPTRLIHTSDFKKSCLNFFSSNIFASTISIYPALAWVFMM